MRTRMLRPGFFTNEHLARLPVRARLLFAGLWCLADREGRLEYRPERIKAALFPYEPRVKIDALIRALELEQFVKRYTVAHTRCLALPRFAQHQQPHHREPASLLPAPPIEPGKARAVPQPRRLDPVTRSSKDQDQDLTDATRRLIPFKRYAAIAAQAFKGPLTSDLGELGARFKTLCAQQDIPYDAAITQKAIDAIIRARARRRA